MLVLFRADADPAIGAGHVMRCLALAEAVRCRGHAACLLAAALPPGLRDRLQAAGIAVRTIDAIADDAADATLATARQLDAGAIVVDGYRFDAAWRLGLGRAGVPILAFSDQAGPDPVGADIVVAPALPPVASDGAIRRLAGLDFVPMRRELAEAARHDPPPMAERRRLLVTFGGSDPQGLTRPVAAALAARLGAAVPLDVVIGPGVTAPARLAAELRSLGDAVAIHRDPPDLAGLMRGAGLAVAAAGGTIFELAALGVPAVIAIVAANQGPGAAAATWCEALDGRLTDAPALLADQAAALWADPAERARRADAARRAIDGQGADRVAAELLAAAARSW